MKYPRFKYLFFFIVLWSCNANYSNQVLTKADTIRIQKLGLLDTNEIIISYTANYKKEVTGSFFTNKRVAYYWIDERYVDRNIIEFAYFEDIKSIDTTILTSLTQASFLTVTKNDDSKFNVYLTGEKDKIKAFFTQATKKWKKAKQLKKE